MTTVGAVSLDLKGVWGNHVAKLVQGSARTLEDVRVAKDVEAPLYMNLGDRA